MAMYDKDWGYVLGSEPQKLRQSLNFYRCHSTNTVQQAGANRKGKLSSCVHRWCVVVVFFSMSHRRKKKQVFFFSILLSHKCGIISARFRTFMLSPTAVFIWWRKPGFSNT